MPNIISPFSLFSILLLNSIPAYATLVLEGRDANGAPSAVCTVSGQAKCTAFYEASLNITILNERVSGSWSSTSAEGSAQANAESIGASSTGLTGWLIPTFEQYALLFYGMGPSD